MDVEAAAGRWWCGGSVGDVGDAGADEYPLPCCRLTGFPVFSLVVSFVGA